jgi:hypothetical protein
MSNLIKDDMSVDSLLSKYAFYTPLHIEAAEVFRKEYESRIDIDHDGEWVAGLPLTRDTSSFLFMINSKSSNVIVEPIMRDYCLNSTVFEERRSTALGHLGVLVREDAVEPWGTTKKPIYTACNTLGIRYADSAYYSAVVKVVYMRENFQHADALDQVEHEPLYWVSSPFIKRGRAVPISKGMLPHNKIKYSTAAFSKAKDAVEFALKIPQITTLRVAFGDSYVVSARNKTAYAAMCKDSEKLGEQAYGLLAHKMGNNALDVARELMLLRDRVKQGKPVVDIDMPIILDAVDKFVTDTEVMRDNVDFAGRHTPVHVVQAGGDPRLYCMTLDGAGNVTNKLVCNSTYDIPPVVMEKLATLEINKDNYETLHYPIEGIPGIGGVMKVHSYKYAVVFIPNDEISAVFA